MIDPVTIGVAYKAATTALDLVKKGIALHKDSAEVGNYLMDFFEKRDEVVRLEKKNKDKKGKASINKEAIQQATYEYNLRKQEAQLREKMMWAGLGDLYRDIQRKKIEIKRERAREEQLRKEKITRIKDFVLYAIVIIICLGICCAILYSLFNWVTTFRDK